MLNFTIFGIPVRVQPFFWILPLFVSGAFRMEPGQGMLQMLIIWTVVIFLSILVHELGHALTGLKTGGGSAAIELNGFGGLAYNYGGRFSLKGRRWMIAMGPGAGFILLALTILAMTIAYGAADGLNLASALAVGITFAPLNTEVINNAGLFIFFSAMIFVNFWWGILNLLPIMPLDGGQLFETFSKSPKLTFKVGMVTGGLVALYGLNTGSVFLMFLMGYLAYNNYRAYQQSKY